MLTEARINVSLYNLGKSEVAMHGMPAKWFWLLWGGKVAWTTFGVHHCWWCEPRLVVWTTSGVHHCWWCDPRLVVWATFGVHHNGSMYSHVIKTSCHPSLPKFGRTPLHLSVQLGYGKQPSSWSMEGHGACCSKRWTVDRLYIYEGRSILTLDRKLLN